MQPGSPLSVTGDKRSSQGILKGEVSLYIWSPVWLVGISCMTTKNFCFYLQNRLIQTSQTGGQQYSDTSPFSIPCSSLFSRSVGDEEEKRVL